jgi:hypothetical protein
MEPHKNLDSSIEKFRPSLDNPNKYFAKAHAFACTYYKQEMDQIASVKHDEVDPTHFFNEYIWVVHATGFSAKAVGKFMPRLLEAYGSYIELALVTPEEGIERVKVVCNNPQKIKAVHKTAILMLKGIKNDGWDKFKKISLSTPQLLKELPYIGPVTCYHLARNIGLLDCVKPDLHLIRLAEHWGFPDCISMCKAMGEGSGLPLGIVDLVVWYSASTFGTIDIRKEGQR